MSMPALRKTNQPRRATWRNDLGRQARGRKGERQEAATKRERKTKAEEAMTNAYPTNVRRGSKPAGLPFTPVIRDIPRVSGIYGLFNIFTGECYVGQAENLRLRLHGHYSALIRRVHPNAQLQAASDAYGWSSLLPVVLEVMPPSLASKPHQKCAWKRDREGWWSRRLFASYNMAGTTEGRYVPSPEQIAVDEDCLPTITA